jgi:hypothetical protein
MTENKVKSNNIRLGDKLSFQAGANIEKHLLGGWSLQEPNHRWTEGDCARLQFHLMELGTKNIILRVECLGYLANGKLDHQSVEVLVNDHKVATWTVRQRAWYEAIVPNELVKNGDVNVNFLVSNPTSPFDANLSLDKRELGLGVLSLEIIATGDVKFDESAAKISGNTPGKEHVSGQPRKKSRQRKR